MVLHRDDDPDRRELIAAALWRVIAREGPAGASMRAIAAEAGCTTGVLTYHFRDKRDLLSYASRLLLDQATARLQAAQTAADLLEVLAQLLPLDQPRRDEARLWLTVAGWSSNDDQLAELLVHGQRAVRDHVRDIVCAAPGPDSAPEHADHLLAVIDGLTLQALIDPAGYPAERQLSILRRALTLGRG